MFFKHGLRPAMVALSGACCALAIPMAQAADVDPLFFGYARSGVGSTAGGGAQTCFRAAGAPAKYRLGNECETYAEIGLGAKLYDMNGKTFSFSSRVSYVTGQSNDFENLANSGNSVALREMYVTGDNVVSFLPGATLWAGKRFYRRHHIEMNDLYYLDVSGPGAGIENINAGIGDLSLAWTRASGSINPGFPSAGQKISGDTIDLRLGDIEVNPGGKLEFAVDYGRANLSDLQKNILRMNGENPDNNDKGWMGTIDHTQSGWFGGFNTIAVQYGTDGIITPSNTVGRVGSVTGDRGGHLFRALDHGHAWLVPNKLDIEYALVYEDKKLDDHTGRKWFSAGVRPYWYWTDIMSTVLEVGYDHVNPQNGLNDDSFNYNSSSHQVTKITLAQQWQPGRGAFVRPAIRIFATYANWTGNAYRRFDDARFQNVSNNLSATAGPNNVDFDSGDGFTFGAQMEVWFGFGD